MNRLEDALKRAASDLWAIGCRWALVGGLAVSIRAEPRFTRDVDLALSVAGDREAEVIASSFLGRGYHVLATVEQEVAKRLATVRLLPPGETEAGVVVDLLFASSGIEPEVIADAEMLDVLPGWKAPVARTGHLIALKLLSRSEARPQDQVDLVSLLKVAAPSEVTRARVALAAIADRGFNRGKALTSELEELLHALQRTG